jgi:hypothetical protein
LHLPKTFSPAAASCAAAAPIEAMSAAPAIEKVNSFTFVSLIRISPRGLSPKRAVSRHP